MGKKAAAEAAAAAGRILRDHGQLVTERQPDGTTRMGIVASTTWLELGDRAAAHQTLVRSGRRPAAR